MSGRLVPKGIGIVSVPIRWLPAHMDHAHDLDSESDHDAAMEKAVAALGALGYALLRSEAHGTLQYRSSRLEGLVERRDWIDVQRASLAVAALDTPADPWQVRAQLLTWELIGVFSEYCDALAALFSAVRARQDGEDLGRALMTFDREASAVLATAAFRDRAWWLYELGLTASDVDEALELLPERLHRPYRWMVSDAIASLDVAITALPAAYEARIHRVAQRRKHAFPFVSPWFGLAWVPEDTTDQRTVMDAIESGAFVVLDGTNEFVVPSDRATFDRVVLHARQASWMHGALAAAIVGRAENPSSRAISHGMEGRPDWMTVEEVFEVTQHITGHPIGAFQRRMIRDLHRTAVAGMASEASPRQGRNEPCACGSGKKYKRCHGAL